MYYNTALGKFSLRSVDDDQINTQGKSNAKVSSVAFLMLFNCQ